MATIMITRTPPRHGHGDGSALLPWANTGSRNGRNADIAGDDAQTATARATVPGMVLDGLVKMLGVMGVHVRRPPRTSAKQPEPERRHQGREQSQNREHLPHGPRRPG